MKTKIDEMIEKKTYETPQMTVVEYDCQGALLADSCGSLTGDVCEED